MAQLIKKGEIVWNPETKKDNCSCGGDVKKEYEERSRDMTKGYCYVCVKCGARSGPWINPWSDGGSHV